MVSPSRAAAWKSRGRGCWETHVGRAQSDPTLGSKHFFPPACHPQTSLPASPGPPGLAGQGSPQARPPPGSLLSSDPPPSQGSGDVCGRPTLSAVPIRSLLSHTCVLGRKRPELQESMGGGSGGEGSVRVRGRGNHASGFLAKNSFLQTRDGKRNNRHFSRFISRE